MINNNDHVCCAVVRHHQCDTTENKCLCKRETKDKLATVSFETFNDDDPDTFESLDFLKIYFDFGFFVCYIPFRLKRMASGEFLISKTFGQQVVCALVHILILFRFIGLLRVLYINYSFEKYAIYTDCAKYAFIIVFHTSFLFTIWTKQNKFLKVISYVNKLASQRRKRASKYFSMEYMVTIVLVIVYVIGALMSFVMGHKVIKTPSWNPILLFQCYACEGRLFFFLSNVTSCKTDPPQLEDLSVRDYLLASSQALTQFYRNLGSFLCHLCLLLSCLTLWWPVRQLGAIIKRRENEHLLDSNYSKVFIKYNQLKKMSKKINSCIGILVMITVVEIIPVFSRPLGDLLKSEPEWFSVFRHLFFQTHLIAVLVIAADICKKTHAIQNWLLKRKYEIPQQELIVLLHEITSRPVGIGIHGAFTISYTLVAQVIGFISTLYFITYLEFQVSVKMKTME